MNILQHIIFPNLEFNNVPEDLYIRIPTGGGGKTLFSRQKKNLIFTKHSSVSFDTFFNSITVAVWKNKTTIKNIKLRLFGQGEFLVKVNLHKLHTTTKFLREEVVNLSEQGISIDFANLDDFTEGMLFFELICLSENGSLEDGYYYTEEEPKNQVKLGIVITHFNRKHYVLPAINRISKDLLEDDYYKNNIKLVVVDNSQNISPEEAQNAIVIPNKNYGGSGGFTRGLLYLKEQGDFTHCLFMDDDASCEIESISRTYALLQYAIVDNFAVGGMQLREIAPNLIYEKGAIFDRNMGGVKPLSGNINISDVFGLLYTDDRKIDYVGWWFFSFKISELKKYPFPFWVRGDDVLFGLQNDFDTCVPNGIAVWAEDFQHKESPLTRYLGMRGLAVCNVLFSAKYKYSLIKLYSHWYLVSLFSYTYSSAKALNLALLDFLNGVKTFTEDLDGSKLREKINSLPQIEKMEPILNYPYGIDFKEDLQENKIRKIFRFLTLNGLFIPKFLMKDMIFQSKGYRATFRQIFAYKKVFYIYKNEQKGYIAEHNKKEIFLGIIDYFKCLYLIITQLDKVREHYLEEEPKITSLEFWQKVYNLENKDKI